MGRSGPPTPIEDLEHEVQAVGRALHDRLPSAARHPVRALDEGAMRLASGDRELRAALFRLVDVAPATRSLDDLARHLGQYLDEVDERTPALATAIGAAHTAAGRRALGAASAMAIRHMAHRFIVGESPEQATRVLSRLWEAGIGSSVDLLGEATLTDDEADRYAARCLEALDTLAAAAARWSPRELLERDSLGTLARVNLSIKVSALTPHLRPEAPELGRDQAARRVRPLLRRAHELGAHLHFDMESLDTLEATLELALALLGEEEFRHGPSAGIVLQAYLRDSPALLEQVLAWAAARERRPPLVVRLVKGAYWDHEIVQAAQASWSPPVFERKADCDRNFEALTRDLLRARPAVRVAIGSHNLRSLAHAIACNRALGGGERDLELQVLRGLGDELAEALAADGHRVRSYCPVGGLVAGMAYLIRRLLENTANESFLDQRRRGAPVQELLAAP